MSLQAVSLVHKNWVKHVKKLMNSHERPHMNHQLSVFCRMQASPIVCDSEPNSDWGPRTSLSPGAVCKKGFARRQKQSCKWAAQTSGSIRDMHVASLSPMRRNACIVTAVFLVLFLHRLLGFGRPSGLSAFPAPTGGVCYLRAYGRQAAGMRRP